MRSGAQYQQPKPINLDIGRLVILYLLYISSKLLMTYIILTYYVYNPINFRRIYLIIVANIIFDIIITLSLTVDLIFQHYIKMTLKNGLNRHTKKTQGEEKHKDNC